MDLISTQRLLARLFTEGPLRKRFYSDPIAVGAEFGIAADEADRLAALSHDRVRTFSQTLVRKRLAEIRRLLPETSRLLGPRLADLFSQHAAEYRPGGLQKHADDARAFGRWLSRPGARVPRALIDLARYESIWLQFHMGRWWPQIALFRVDPRTTGDAKSNSPRSRRTFILWFRLAGRVRHVCLCF